MSLRHGVDHPLEIRPEYMTVVSRHKSNGLIDLDEVGISGIGNKCDLLES